MWRDLRVLEHLDNLIAEQNRTAVFFILTSAIGKRSTKDIEEMERAYNWPVLHRQGAPDLVGPEAILWENVDAFNRKTKAIRAVLVNQFGWDQNSCGMNMPPDMSFMDLRKGTDLEFGQSIYEPFGIAVLEPLSFGAVCVPSSVCGCCGFLLRVTNKERIKNVVISDYTTLDSVGPIADTRAIGVVERNHIEATQSELLAWEISSKLPKTDAERFALLQQGFDLAQKMSWDVVCQDYFLPGIQRAIDRRDGNV